MIINYELYQIFYYVASCGNITAAASRLYLSQSTVSRAIQNLEKELNCTLFLRSQKGMELTADGNYLFSHVKKAFSEISIAENHLHALGALETGFLRIGVTEMTLHYYLLKRLRKFRDDYPGIQVSLSFEKTKPALSELHENTLDIAVLTTPVPEDPQLLIQRQTLCTIQDVMIGGNRFRHLAGRKVAISELEDEAFIMMEEGTSTWKYVRNYFEQYNTSINEIFHVCSLSLIRTMAEMNMGLGILPEIYLKEYDGSDLFIVDLKEALPKREICALTSTDCPIHPVRDTFMKYLLQ
ncbi:transcriptional regulator [Clostridium sp. SY8519]|nr:LysR family transcriptional regulator [Clostridium sp. SY8519]BAK47597.1 transcriptional regulator [Clostridium sp. SY8519]